MRSLPFVLLSLASLWVLYLGVRPPAPPPAPPSPHVHTPAAPTTASPTTDGAPAVRFDDTAPGYEVYRSRGCQTCHGIDGLGTRMGPSLAEVRLHFDRESLAVYLADPVAALENDDRLQRLQSRYPRIEMPAYPDLPEAELEQLLGFVLEPELP